MRSLNGLAWRNLSAHALRTILSALSVALGVAVLVSASVCVSGIRAAWENGESRAGFLVEMSNVASNGVGIIFLATAGFLVFNAFAMTVTQQQQQIGMLRLLGMTQRQVMGSVLLEAALTGGLGTLLGLLGGPLLGRAVLALARQMMGLDVGRGTASLPVLILATGMGLGVTVLSAVIPARRATRVAPLVALRETAIPSSQEAGPVRKRLSVLARFALPGALSLYLVIAPPGKWSGYHPPWDWIMVLVMWAAWLTGLLLVTPILVGWAVRGLRGLLRRTGGTMGRLAGDNLERAPSRVVLTALTFAAGLMTIVGTGGIVDLGNGVLVRQLAENALRESAWYFYPYDRSSGLGQVSGFSLDAPGLPPQFVADVYSLAAGRARVDQAFMILVPEISSPLSGFPSFTYSDVDRLAEPGAFDLQEGDWDTVLPLMRGDQCAVLITPAVAARNGVQLGGRLTVTGRSGPVECLVAGLGAGGFTPMSLINPGARDAFVAVGKDPDGLVVRPLADADTAGLEADLLALVGRYPGRAFLSRPEGEYRAILDVADQMMSVLNIMVGLGVVGAALGMINTTLVSVLERRRELGLLRAIGTTRRQIVILVVGEAALVGLIGVLLGILAGIGLSTVTALAFGGARFGLADLPLWWAAGQTILPALRNGWFALVVAPLLAALAAVPAVYAVVRGPAVETLQPEKRQTRMNRRRT